MSGFSREFNTLSTADDVIAGIDMTGKTALITGASTGLGAEAARVMAVAGAKVIMAVRNREKAELVRASIVSEQPEAQLTIVELELGDLDSVRRCADTVLAEHDSLDVLLANAGIMACGKGETAQGHEMQFGTNHLGHFLLTCLLVPALKKAAPSRAVVLSSAAHKYGDVDLADPDYRNQDYDKWMAYGRSKTANAQFSAELNRRLVSYGITANAVHPGMVMTELGRNLEQSDFELLGDMAKQSGTQFKTPAQGAATEVWAATAPELEGKGGLYLEDCTIGVLAKEGNTGGYQAYALDLEAASRLWSVSEKLVGQVFEF
ncbi:MAG: SDR family NAD(P)-dependent oxidoreductase [Pseudomonadales bacterium]